MISLQQKNQRKPCQTVKDSQTVKKYSINMEHSCYTNLLALGDPGPLARIGVNLGFAENLVTHSQTHPLAQRFRTAL